MALPENKIPKTEPNTPSTTPPATPPQGTNNEGGDGEGEGKSKISLETLDEATRKFVESELGKARRAAIKDAETKAAKDNAEKERLAAEKAAREAGNFEQLLATEQSAHNATRATLASIQTELRKIKVAIEAELPNPLSNYKRIVDNDDDEALLADAKALKESFGPTAHRDPNAPPATPDGKGGRHVDANTPNEKKQITDEKVAAEVQGTGMYTRM